MNTIDLQRVNDAISMTLDIAKDRIKVTYVSGKNYLLTVGEEEFNIMFDSQRARELIGGCFVSHKSRESFMANAIIAYWRYNNKFIAPVVKITPKGNQDNANED